MASAFGHAITAIALGNGYSKKVTDFKFWLLGITCSILPDADVLGFQFGIAYGSFWGHRGFSHSLLFAAILGLLVTLTFYQKELRKWRKALVYFFYFFLCTASHGFLDALTSGGKGIAFFSPWDNTRYFLPWRPIKVSPIGIENFFGEWGKQVLLSEFNWIGVPCLGIIVLALLLKRLNN